MKRLKKFPGLRWLSGMATAVALACLALGATPRMVHAQVAITQQPLTVANNVPGNVVLTPSVEYPTVLSYSNLGSFDASKTYGGYFDPDKCYTYDSTGQIPTDTPAPQRANPKGETGYFVPASKSSASPATCSGQWSGNYLNWAATQTIDTFRSVMTGGYRVVDTTSTTVLEKARHTGQGGEAETPARSISSSSEVTAATPANFRYFYTRLRDLGNKMYFVAANDTDVCTRRYNNGYCRDSESLQDLLNDVDKDDVEAYTGQTIKSGQVYSVNVDVEVCVNGLLESDCVKYGTHYKPEGLIQKYSKTLKYSVFGYLNISDIYQDGAALRAKQKFVGPYTYSPVDGKQPNPAKEWDPDTGILIKNPDADAATATSTALDVTIADSGVINYINKFGEMTDTDDKSYDPVSEMYYAAIRYLKDQSPVASYSKNTTNTTPPNYDNKGSNYTMADGFPIITASKDPIKFKCQKNFILGIGDVNTHRDKNLPGNQDHSEEPAVPSEVSADNTVNVLTAVKRIGTIEGINTLGNLSSSNGNGFSGRNNSAYIAGLAYDSHTQDMRPRMDGMQTVSTYWVDVEENQVLKPMRQNQYLLATKYGGFTVPKDYKPYQRTEALPKSWWSTTGDVLTTSGIDEARPDNFFEGGDATAMRTGLNAAFSRIESENAGSKASLSLNTTQLQANSTVYQASYVEGLWTGSLQAYAIDPDTQTVAGIASWTASLPAYGSRKVYTNVSGTYEKFNSSNVSGNGWTADVVNYVLGDTSKEIRNGGTLRSRTTALGDIVHSQPIYVGAPNLTAFLGATFPGTSGDNSYSSFAQNQANRESVIYVAANDGMLHGFDADTGVETYAYMPGAVLSASTNPSVMANPNYGTGVNPHQFFNDGELTVADVYYSDDWHTVLVGTTGRGETKTIYALDITSPDPTKIKLLWEISGGADHPHIGQITGSPVIARTKDGWVVLVGNGYNSIDGTAALLSIPLDGSSTSPTVSVYTTDSETDNGLATPGVWIGDVSGYVATEAYAGDLKGNVWKFDLSTAGGAGTKVFTTQSGQPITAPIALGLNPTSGDLWAFFGTGKYLAIADLEDKTLQSWYGIDVSGTLPVKLSDLVQRKVIVETSGTAADPTTDPPTAAVAPARAFSQGETGDMSGKVGWYMDLEPPDGTKEGERMIVRNQFVDGYLVGDSLIPDTSDPCAPGGRGWVMALEPFTGTNPKDIYFDLNRDAIFNNTDEVKSGDSSVAAGGMGLNSLTGASSFTGALMLNNLNGTTDSRRVNPPSGQGGRVSWREVVH